MKHIKLARKRKTTKPDKVTDEFFLKYSKWRTGDINRPSEIIPAREYNHPSRPSSPPPQQVTSVTYARQAQKTPQTIPVTLPQSQLYQKELESETELETNNTTDISDSEYYPSSAEEFIRKNVVQNELGTFGIDNENREQTEFNETTLKPSLFDQLSEALESPGTISDSIRSLEQDSVITDTPISQDQRKGIISGGSSKINIDALSSKIGSLIREVEAIKSAEESKQVIEDEKMSVSSTKIEESDFDAYPTEKSESEPEQVPKIIPTKISDEEDISKTSIGSASESNTEDNLIDTLRAKISQVMDFSDQFTNKFRDESETTEIDSILSEEESINPPKFESKSDSRFEKDQEIVLKTRTSNKAPLDKEKLQSVLGLLNDEEKPIEKKDSPVITEHLQAINIPEDIREVKLKIRRKYSFDSTDESINVKFKYENKLPKVYNKDYEIKETAPEGWKTDSPTIIFIKNKMTDEKEYKIILKGPITEWRLSTGKFN